MFIYIYKKSNVSVSLDLSSIEIRSERLISGWSSDYLLYIFIYTYMYIIKWEIQSMVYTKIVLCSNMFLDNLIIISILFL